MATMKMDRLESLGLIVGPVLALLFFLLEPGSLLIDPAEPGDAVATITAMATNQTMAHISGIVVPLSLVLMLYGLTGINRVIQQEKMAAALSRLGTLCITVGAIGWVLTSGMNHVLAQTRIDAEQALQQAIAVYKADSGVTIISSMAVAAGILAFSLGLSALYPPGFHKIAALVIAAVSILALVALIIGHIGPNPDMILVSRACYFPWVVWIVFLGVGFLRGTGLPQAGDR